MKLFFSVLLLIIVGGCVDIPISKAVQSYFCNEIAGTKVYEAISLPDEFYLEIPGSKSDARELDSSFFIDEVNFKQWSTIPTDLKRIDQTAFQSQYRLEALVQSELSIFGPVSKFVSRLIRIEDSKILSEAISISRGPGWLSAALPFPANLKTCVSPETVISGVGLKVHTDLIRSTIKTNP